MVIDIYGKCFKSIFFDINIMLLLGCDECDYIGYKGCIFLFEIIIIDY